MEVTYVKNLESLFCLFNMCLCVCISLCMCIRACVCVCIHMYVYIDCEDSTMVNFSFSNIIVKTDKSPEFFFTKSQPLNYLKKTGYMIKKSNRPTFSHPLPPLISLCLSIYHIQALLSLLLPLASPIPCCLSPSAYLLTDISSLVWRHSRKQ